MQVKEGDKVIISEYGGTEVKIGDEEYKIVIQDTFWQLSSNRNSRKKEIIMAKEISFDIDVRKKWKPA